MKDVIVKYSQEMNTIYFPDGTQYCVASNIDFQDAPSVDILSLVKAGLTAEDLINLKKNDLL